MTGHRITRESVISKAADELCRYIEAEKLGSGDRLPTEVQLSRMLGVSRNSLREALRILHALGFVEKLPGQGLRVKNSFGAALGAPFEESAVLDAAPVAFQIRMVLEGRCAELAAQAGTEADFAELAGQLALFEEGLKRGDLVSATLAHVAFHDIIVRAARNPFLASIFQQVRFVISEIGRRGAQKTYKNPRQLAAHREIYDALSKRDSQRAAGAVKRHFQLVTPIIEFISKSPRVADRETRASSPLRRR